MQPADITRAALIALRPVLGDVGVIAETPLPSTDGSTSVRLLLITDGGAKSVVVRSAHASWVRERAALRDRHINGMPVLLADHDDPPLLVIDDVDGTAADMFIGNDPVD